MEVWKNCCLGYEDMERKRYHKEITEDQFQNWFMSHCELCPFMHTICMYGEVLPDGHIYDEYYLEHEKVEQQIESTIDIEDWSNW